MEHKDEFKLIHSSLLQFGVYLFPISVENIPIASNSVVVLEF